MVTLIATLLLSAQSGETRESNTFRYRSFEEIVRKIAARVEAASGRGSERVLIVWLLDNASSLSTSGQGEMLAEYIRRAFGPERARVHHAVMTVGKDPQIVLKPIDDPKAASRAVEEVSKGRPDDRIKNCLLSVRAAAKYAAGFGGKRFLVLFTQENGDTEDDLEGTLRLLNETGVVFLPICGEAVYSDPYWDGVLEQGGFLNSNPEADKYRKLKLDLKGPESAYVEFPYGWLFQRADPAYTVPSGFGTYGLHRLAAHTGGTCFLYNGESSSSTFCSRFGCVLCSGEHRECGGGFDVTKLLLTEPDVSSREQVRERCGRQKLFVAVVSLWEKLYRIALLGAPPKLKLVGGKLQEAPRGQAATNPFLTGNDWKAKKARTVRALSDLEKFSGEFAEAIATEAAISEKRVAALADALWVYVRILRLNLTQWSLYCDEMDRVARRPGSGSREEGAALGRLDEFAGKRIGGTTVRNLYLCHGSAALRGIAFLGGEAFEREKREVLELADRTMERHRGTPWETLIRRASLVVFVPMIEMKDGGVRRGKPRTETSDAISDIPTRPGRPTASDESGGTATGD